MSWENEIKKYYEDKMSVRVLYSQEVENKDLIDDYFNNIALPALEELKEQLEPHVQEIKVSRISSKVKISFKDDYFKKSVFFVDFSIKNVCVSFPYQLNNVLNLGAVFYLEPLDEQADLGMDFIIEEFMRFFNSRKEIMEESEAMMEVVS
ncbi:hypothetical protein [Colwellia sp. 20A7]|uniref:hypothetical protein n=1 Tax=Colwellia sp. 20A7 TaxID=2689569 RepID=UPI00135BC53A|nr:hypothetical protein [Colwellia sp. 20A7]